MHQTGEAFMKSTLLSALVALLVLLAVSTPPAQAWPGVTVYVAPGYYRPGYYPRYYYPPVYLGVYGSPYVISSGVPIPVPLGSAYVASPATTLTLAPTPVPQLAPAPGNAALQAGAQPGAAAVNQADIDQAFQLLSNPRERDRIEAAIELGRARVAKAIEPLQQVLAGDPSPRVREAAARGLGLIGSPSSLRALQTAAQSDDDREVRRSAQFAAETIRGNLR
jgi:hypothetical protein